MLFLIVPIMLVAGLIALAWFFLRVEQGQARSADDEGLRRFAERISGGHGGATI